MSAAMLAWVAVASAAVVDRVVLVVGSRLVTASDLAFEVELDTHDASPVPALQDRSRAPAARVADIAVLRELAGDSDLYRPSSGAVRARWERFRDAWGPGGYDDFLRRWGMGDDALLGFFSSRLVVERYALRAAASGAFDLDDPASFDTWLAAERGRAGIRIVTVSAR